MNKKMITVPKLKGGHPSDHFQTPCYAVASLLPHIQKVNIRNVWECASGSLNISKFLESNEISVHSSDVINGQNFLEYVPKDFNYECIITNVPFSLKNEFFIFHSIISAEYIYLFCLISKSSNIGYIFDIY